MPVSAHRPAQRAVARKKRQFSFLFEYCLALTFDGGVAGGPSTVFNAARPYGRIALLLPSGAACRGHKPTKIKSGGRTPTRTFVGTLGGFGFHLFDVDG